MPGRFHALLPVRDEADIIGHSLRHLLTWADAIYVFDTGSVDNSWEIVQDYAARDRRVIALRKDAVFFSDTEIRGWIFHQARQQMREGDWFLRVDADEFHHLRPPDFVQTRLRKHETVVWHQYYDFRLTASEVRAWEAGEETALDRVRPIEQRRQWFTASIYSEPRLFRYRETMRWPGSRSLPYNAGFVARERLPIRHYPHRDPDQLRRRVRLRALMMANYHHWADLKNHHWAEGEWRKFITPDNLAGLQRWQPGKELPEFHFTSHLRPPPVRAIQRLIHGGCLPVLDRTRAGWSDADYPRRIPAELAQVLEQDLADKNLCSLP